MAIVVLLAMRVRHDRLPYHEPVNPQDRSRLYCPGLVILAGEGVDMRTIFRVQDKDGRGPWKPGFSQTWVEDRPDHDNLPPWTVEFGRIDRQFIVGPAYGSGCLTLEQLQRWFTESEYKKLLACGYRAVKMEVDRVLAESDIQCVFRRYEPLKNDVTEIDLYPKVTP